MELDKTQKEDSFEPYTLEIEIESQADEDLMRFFAYADASIPTLIDKAYNGFKDMFEVKTSKVNLMRKYNEFSEAFLDLFD